MNVGIIGTGKYVPENILTNQHLEQMVDTSDEWIRTRTGIVERRTVSPEQATSDLALEAAKEALANANLAPEDVDLIVVATITPDSAFPSTACIVQEAGREKAAAFDLSAACSGFIYGLATASVHDCCRLVQKCARHRSGMFDENYRLHGSQYMHFVR